MPLALFHFGPGTALHSAAPRHISFLAFCAANVLVDIEPLYYMVNGQFWLHRFFHTYVGISIVVVGTVALFVMARRLALLVSLPNFLGWKQLTYRQVVSGAALGGYSHIVLDSVMHTDIRPLAPFSQSNVLLHSVSLGALHWSCVLAAIIGLVVLGIRSVLREENAF